MTIPHAVPSSTPRAGRRFEPMRELELHDDAARAVRDLPRVSSGLVVVPEFAGPIGIPDFTAYVGDVDRIRQRQSLEVPPIVNQLDTGILAAVFFRKPSSDQQVAARLEWPLDVVTDRLRRLKKRGALIETSPGKYVRLQPLEPGGRLYAVEAKVEDWRSALRQVRTYRVWADSYVLVMGAISDRAGTSLASEVRRDGGGLMISGRWLLRPRLGPVISRRRVQAWELFAAATKGGLNDPSFALRVHS